MALMGWFQGQWRKIPMNLITRIFLRCPMEPVNRFLIFLKKLFTKCDVDYETSKKYIYIQTIKYILFNISLICFTGLIIRATLFQSQLLCYDFLLVLLRRARKARSLRTTARTTRSRMLRVKSSWNQEIKNWNFF